MQFNLNFRGHCSEKWGENPVATLHWSQLPVISSRRQASYSSPQTLKSDLWVRDSWIRSALHHVRRVTEISCWWISIVCMWSAPGLDGLMIPYGPNYPETLLFSKSTFLTGNVKDGELQCLLWLVFILKCKHGLWLVLVTALSADI